MLFGGADGIEPRPSECHPDALPTELQPHLLDKYIKYLKTLLVIIVKNHHLSQFRQCPQHLIHLNQHPLHYRQLRFLQF